MDSALGAPSYSNDENGVSCCTLQQLAEKYFKRAEVPLPGTGKKPPHCDGWYCPKFCPNCNTPVLRKGNCKKAVCPDCSTSWRFDRAESIFERIMSFKYEKDKRIRHFVISPSDRLVKLYLKGKISFQYLFEEAQKVVKWKTRGGHGAVIFPHPYRLTNEGKRKAKELKREKEDMAPGECGHWKALLTLDNWRDYVYFSPHFHALCVTDRGKNWREGREKMDGGFLWEGIREIKSFEEVVPVVMYLLSHAWVLSESEVEGEHAVRWIGDLSNSNWSFEEASKGVQARVKSEFNLRVREYEEAEGYAENECLECGAELEEFTNLPESLGKIDTEDKKVLFTIYLFQHSGKDPPRDLDTPEEFISWLKKEYPTIFSEGSIFDGVQPEAVRHYICSMPEEVKREEKLRRKYWSDPQKVLEHFLRPADGVKYYGDMEAV